MFLPSKHFVGLQVVFKAYLEDVFSIVIHFLPWECCISLVDFNTSFSAEKDVKKA